MELLHVVLGQAKRQHGAAVAQHLGEQAVRFAEAHHDRVLVRRFEFHYLSADHQPGRGHIGQLLVERAVVMREVKVLAGKRMAVRPFHALAQVKGESGRVVAHLPTLGDSWQDRGRRAVPVKQRLVTQTRVEPHVPLGLGQAPPRAAILSNRLDRLDNRGPLRQALLHHRQLAALHARGEDRRFLIGAGQQQQQDGKVDHVPHFISMAT